MLISAEFDLVSGKMSMEQYILSHKTSLDDLIKFARKLKVNGSVIKKLYSLKGEYKALRKPFIREKYVGIVRIMVGNQYVAPTDEDVDGCIQYLRDNGRLVCGKTVKETVRGYLRGEIEIPESPDRGGTKDTPISPTINPVLSESEAADVSRRFEQDAIRNAEKKEPKRDDKKRGDE